MSADDGAAAAGPGSAPPTWREDLAVARRTGELPGFVYERVLVSIIPRLRGRAALAVSQLIYKNLSVGARPRCWGGMSVLLARTSSITIGDDLWAVSDPRRAAIALYSPCKLRTFSGAHICIGNKVGLNGTSITSACRIEIGDGTLVAANVSIVDADFPHSSGHPRKRWSVSDGRGQPVIIGRNVWIGVSTIVLKGATIGDKFDHRGRQRGDRRRTGQRDRGRQPRPGRATHRPVGGTILQLCATPGTRRPSHVRLWPPPRRWSRRQAGGPGGCKNAA